MEEESKHVSRFREIYLKPDENIVAWGEGYIGEMMGKGDKTQHNGVLLVTDSRVVFYRKGILGEVLETIPIMKITSIERKSILGHRTIRIHTSHDDLEFKTFDKEKEQALYTALENGRERTSDHSPSDSKQTDAFEALKKLAELKESGVITEKEFAAKKAEILSKI
ncbi:MAG: PH domain-containing protein [candidate division Zixibacteria bacterium]|nr:PH domain-containing protein [candidate division Zixibacteria bacterium]